MTAAQRATLEELADDLERTVEVVSSRDGDATARQYDRAAALRAALGTCGTCAHAGEAVAFTRGWVFCAAPERTEFPLRHQAMPLGERCTGWTPKADE